MMLTAEYALAVALSRRHVWESLASRDPVHGWVCALMLLVFAAMPARCARRA